MKTYFYSLLSFLLILCSCEDYLENKDGDKVIPNTLKHYDELIYGEIIKQASGSEMAYLPLMTDDVEDETVGYYDSDSRTKYFPYYTWAIENQRGLLEAENIDNAWAFFYHKILMCNIVYKDVSELEDDVNGMKNRLLGEVSFLRAMSYFYLVNLYGEPYQDAEQAKTALGVPINTEVGVENRLYQRAKLQEIYDLMEKDLLAALEFFKKGEQLNSIFKPEIDVTRLFLSRVYLFQKKYDKVISVCNDLISQSAATVATIKDIENYPEDEFGYTYLYNSKNPSILFTWGIISEFPLSSSYIYTGGYYKASSSLTDLYAEYDDIRGTFYIDEYSPVPKKYSQDENSIYFRCYRIEEAYLNRAEAIIQSGSDFGAAMQDIEEIRKNRITSDYEVSADNREDALKLLQREKRMEFCFEEMRWFDIRRWGLEIVHRYHDKNNTDAYKEYKLRPESPNYTLSLPLDLQRLNTSIERIAREDIQPQ